jgi:ribonuclease-3
LSYSYRDPGLLERALTHRSFANESRTTEHNERMEFLGDAVLNLIVSERLMEARPQAPEGELSRHRASIVSEPSLAAVARDLGLGAYLRLGRGEELTGGRNKDSLLANSFEALIASLYLDGGLAAAATLIEQYFRNALLNAGGAGMVTDFKTTLQERCQERMKVLPEYRVVSQSGPDHQKEFTVELRIKGDLFGRGMGRSKKEAEQRAAEEALEKLSADRGQSTEDRR